MDRNQKREEILNLMEQAQRLLNASRDNQKRLLDIYHGLLIELSKLDNDPFYMLQSLEEDEGVAIAEFYSIKLE